MTQKPTPSSTEKPSPAGDAEGAKEATSIICKFRAILGRLGKARD